VEEHSSGKTSQALKILCPPKKKPPATQSDFFQIRSSHTQQNQQNTFNRVLLVLLRPFSPHHKNIFGLIL
jgi:hypothetical protein